MSAFDQLGRAILSLDKRMEQLDRRLNNIVREAKVLEVDAGKGLVKVEAHGLKSGWMPWVERAGAIREWSPPAKDERVIVLSPTGEPGQGLVLAGGFSDQFKQPSTDAGERLTQIGDNKLSMTAERTIVGFPDDGRAVIKRDIVKLKIKDTTWIVLTKDGITVSHTPEIGPDPDPD